MERLENKEHVTKIVMWPTAYTKCKIGQDWYKCEFEIHFIPSTCYPDYMEVHRFVMEQIDGKELNIEEAAAILRDMLEKNYHPQKLKVINHIAGCKTHFNVDVVIE